MFTLLKIDKFTWDHQAHWEISCKILVYRYVSVILWSTCSMQQMPSSNKSVCFTQSCSWISALVYHIPRRWSTYLLARHATWLHARISQNGRILPRTELFLFVKVKKTAIPGPVMVFCTPADLIGCHSTDTLTKRWLFALTSLAF